MPNDVKLPRCNDNSAVPSYGRRFGVANNSFHENGDRLLMQQDDLTISWAERDTEEHRRALRPYHLHEDVGNQAAILILHHFHGEVEYCTE